MKNKNSRKFVKLRQETKLLWILILAIVAVLFWIMVSILSPKKEQVISQQLRELAKPLTPTFDQEILDLIPEKRYLEDAELESFSIFVLVNDELTDVPKLVDIVNQRTIEIAEPVEIDAQLKEGSSSSQLQQLSNDELQLENFGESEDSGNQ